MGRRCWCGADALVPFGRDYERCVACETLVLAVELDARADRVVDDDGDFYGKSYWLSRADCLGLANLDSRARTDLADRCLHWLRTVLTYRSPPAKVLELGAAHGGFVALLRCAGFDAAGLELSPWVADYARRVFEVPMYEGPVEEQSISPGSLDLVAAFDVVEHLADPLRTLRHCEQLLATGGLLLLQTPVFPEGSTFDELEAAASPILDQLSAVKGHVYVFSERSLSDLLRRIGLPHVVFRPAIFAHYDMFLLASRAELRMAEVDEAYAALENGATSRIVRALLDVDDSATAAKASLARSESDVAFLKEKARTLAEKLEQQGSDGARIAMLEAQLAASEADRAARLEVIERQGRELGRIPTLEAELAASEADRAARLEVIERQGSELGRIPALEAELSASEADRAARLEVIERQGSELGRIPGLEADIAFLTERVGALQREVEGDRAELSQQMAETTKLRVRIELARSSRTFRLLRRLGLLRGLDPRP